MNESKFIIIYDTYCGWCYGAAPIFDALVDTGARVDVFHRHLFQGANAPKLSDGKGDYMTQTDARISELSGQVFSQAYTENVVKSDTEILDSSYSALAAALIHHHGAPREFSLRRRLEKLRFIDGVSAQNRDAVVMALIDEGVSPHSAQSFDQADNRARAQAISRHAVSLMSKLNSQSVPTMIRVKKAQFEQIDHSLYYGKPTLVQDLLIAEQSVA